MRHGKYHIYIAQHRGGETQAQRDKIQGPRERQRESERQRDGKGGRRWHRRWAGSQALLLNEGSGQAERKTGRGSGHL